MKVTREKMMYPKRFNVLHCMSARGLYGAERVLINLVKYGSSHHYNSAAAILLNKLEPANDVIHEIESSGKKVIAFPCKRWIDIDCLRKLCNFIKENHIDILHCHEMKSRLYGLIAARVQNIPMITTHNNWCRNKLSTTIFEYVDAVYIRFSDRIIAVSENVFTSLRKCGISAHQIRTIINGISCIEPVSSSADTISLRQSLSIGSSLHIVGMVGRISIEKGPRYFVEAAKQVLTIRDDIRFILVGDGPLKKEMQHYSQKLEISDKICFTGFRSDVAAFYALMDICVMPSLLEGTPMTLLEAMSAGKPVVASRVGGIPYVIQQHENGILTEPRQPEEIARAILLLIENKELYLRISENARQTIKEKFSIERMVSEYEEEYRRLLTLS